MSSMVQLIGLVGNPYGVFIANIYQMLKNIKGEIFAKNEDGVIESIDKF